MKNSPQVSETIEGRFLIFEVPNSEKLFQILYFFFSQEANGSVKPLNVWSKVILINW